MCVSSEGQCRFHKWWNFRRNSTTHLKQVKESLCPCWVPEDQHLVRTFQQPCQAKNGLQMDGSAQPKKHGNWEHLRRSRYIRIDHKTYLYLINYLQYYHLKGKKNKEHVQKRLLKAPGSLSFQFTVRLADANSVEEHLCLRSPKHGHQTGDQNP